MHDCKELQRLVAEYWKAIDRLIDAGDRIALSLGLKENSLAAQAIERRAAAQRECAEVRRLLAAHLEMHRCG